MGKLMAKLKGLGIAVGIAAFGFLLMGNPLASPNLMAALGTVELLGALLIVAGLAIGAIVLGTGSNIQVGGQGNSIDNSTTNITVQQPPPGTAVGKHMGGKKKRG